MQMYNSKRLRYASAHACSQFSTGSYLVTDARIISACERKTDASDVTNSGERDPRDVNAIVVEAIQLYSCKVK